MPRSGTNQEVVHLISGTCVGLLWHPNCTQKRVNIPVARLRLRHAFAPNPAHGSLFVKVLTGFLLLSLVAGKVKGDIFVPGNYPTIQAAINAANPGDIIHIAAGRYAETLFINKSLTLSGSGSSNCVIYSSTNIPLVNISGPATVSLSGIEVNGGNYLGGNYNGVANYGITATNANIVLNDMVVNQIINYMVTVAEGALAATNVSLWTRNILVQCDIGLELKDCTGTVSHLTQDGGRIDHTINIEAAITNHSDIGIDNCRIRTSSGSYGNCIRTYINSTVHIANCFLYRASGDPVPAFPAFNHSAISVNGYTNSVFVTGNVISNAPWAMYFYGSPGLGGNHIMIQSNTILNSTIGGLVMDGMNYRGVDIGGGALASQGGNIFLEVPAAPATFFADILLTNSSAYPSVDIFALHNTWSNPTNKESVIYDRLDSTNSGRLITDDLLVKNIGFDSSNRPVISWNERRAGEKYTVEVCGALNQSNWVPAQGIWPISNMGAADMLWTNPAPASSNIFVRIRSAVP